MSRALFRTSRRSLPVHILGGLHACIMYRVGTVDRRGQQKHTIFDACGQSPSIWSTLKLVFRKIRLISWAYESLRCLNITEAESGHACSRSRSCLLYHMASINFLLIKLFNPRSCSRSRSVSYSRSRSLSCSRSHARLASSVLKELKVMEYECLLVRLIWLRITKVSSTKRSAGVISK
jgi:hypothetical protein